MSDTFWNAVIAAVPSIVSLLTYLRVQQVHVQINSRMDQLLKSVRAEATAQEQIAGRARQDEEDSLKQQKKKN